MNINADRIKRVITNLRQCDADHGKIGVYTFEDAIEAIEQLTKERDLARKMYCGVDNCTADEAMLLAKEQGWDCYEEPVPLKRKTLSESDPRIISIDELEQTIRNSQMYD